MPEAGRNWEGFSPDPVLSGIAVAETIKGIQDAGVIACTKHFILNEQEHFRQAPEAQGYGYDIKESLSSNVDDVTMHELYLWPFADAVRAGTGAIMCSYQQINNSYGCQNSYTMNYLLKGELGFQGFVMSDWQAQHTGVSSSLAGLDMTMPGDTSFDTGVSYWGTNLTVAVLNGTIPEWRIDDMATRIMAAYYFVGRDKVNTPLNFNTWTRDQFGYQHAVAQKGYGEVNKFVDVRDEHGATILEAAAKSTVLLKNEGVLPLTGKERFTALFGKDAGDSPVGPNGCADRGCDKGTLAMGWGSGTSNFPYLISPLTAITNYVVSMGGLIQSVTKNEGYEGTDLAKQATHSIVFVNADSGEGYINVAGNEGDRKNLTLWYNGEQLVKNIAGACNNTIVVIHSVGPVVVEGFKDHPNVTAILWAGLPGQESGNAIRDVLYGKTNPSGKLPFTIGAKRKDYGVDVLYQPNNGKEAPQQNFQEGVFIDYRHFDKADIDPSYEFGFGLSYTTFEYSDIQVVPATLSPYTPTTGETGAAPKLGSFDKDPAAYQYPEDIDPINLYIYPYLNSTNLKKASQDPHYGQAASTYLPRHSRDGSPQAKVPAGGAPGGNPALWDLAFTVSATLTNTGSRDGEEVVQAYVNLGGPDDPKVVLRGFEKVALAAGQSETVTINITRRDVSNWDTKEQNWCITDYPKTVYVGSSSRNLPLSAPLEFSG
jgi:beta-glucosidase